VLLSLLLAGADPAALLTPPPAEPAPGARPPSTGARGSRQRRAKTLTVDCHGGADYVDINDALHDARSGDTITVAPCTYYGSIEFGGRSVTITSTDGAAVTTILASPGEPVVTVDDGEGSGTILAGFTLSGGGGPLVPAIDNEFSSLTLRDDIVTGNVGPNTVYSHGGHLLLEHTTLQDNTATDGQVIRARRGAIVLKDSTVVCGAVGIGYIGEHGASIIDGSTFVCPGAIAVEIYHNPGRVQRSVLDGLLYIENETTDSETSVAEGDVLLAGASVYDAALTVRNSVSTAGLSASYAVLVVEASVVTGAECGITSSRSSVSTRSDIFWGNTADACGMATPVGTNGTTSVDPKFVDAAAHDFHLAATSPALNAGPTDAGYADPDGTRNDIGAYGGPLSLGGGW
jgi:hypothetical protein